MIKFRIKKHSNTKSFLRVLTPLSVDNNAAENAIRPFVIGRKNWLFSNTPSGAQASANMYSIIETAKAHGLNPQEYRTHVYKETPLVKSIEDYEKLLPWNFKSDNS